MLVCLRGCITSSLQLGFDDHSGEVQRCEVDIEQNYWSSLKCRAPEAILQLLGACHTAPESVFDVLSCS